MGSGPSAGQRLHRVPADSDRAGAPLEGEYPPLLSSATSVEDIHGVGRIQPRAIFPADPWETWPVGEPQSWLESEEVQYWGLPKTVMH